MQYGSCKGFLRSWAGQGDKELGGQGATAVGFINFILSPSLLVPLSPCPFLTRKLLNRTVLEADDYLSKPFSLKELEARICSLLGRVEKTDTSSMPNSGVVQVGTLRININKRQVYKGHEQIRLTSKEFNLLSMLISRCGKTVSRSEILEKVWGYTLEQRVDMRIVDVHISRLRANLENEPNHPELILTARGSGYLFQRFDQ